LINNLIREESNIIKEIFTDKCDNNLNLISRNQDKISQLEINIEELTEQMLKTDKTIKMNHDDMVMRLEVILKHHKREKSDL
jgi:TolA-binding protein